MFASLIRAVARFWNVFARRLFISADTTPRLPPPLLIDRGFGLLYDVERNLTWLHDTNYAKTTGRSPDGQLTWDDARAWVARLNYRGITGWRLPTALNPGGSGPCEGTDCRDSELGHLVFTAFQRPSLGLQLWNWQPFSIYWSGTEANATEAFAFKMSSFKQGKLVKNPWATDPVLGGAVPLADVVLTWPVHDGDISVSLFHRLIAAIFQRDRISASTDIRRAGDARG